MVASVTPKSEAAKSLRAAAAVTATLERRTAKTLRSMIASARTPRLRTMREWAEQCLVIPEGKHRDTLFRVDTQPWARLLLDEYDAGRYNRFAVYGCVQSGKSLLAFVTPILYNLFQRKETVICGCPTMEMAAAKWSNELLPVILAGPYRQYLPTSGKGSRGGWSEEITFTNGATLRWMSAGGGDEQRSSYTSRVVVCTEVDKMDEAGDTSREADPITQMEARAASYDLPERLICFECTVSIETGRIHQEYLGGTASRVACPCPNCGEYVTPERDHLVGWQDARTAAEAERGAWFACPECGEEITDAQRRTMNESAKLVHRGQTIDADGTVHGDPPDTRTLGFRWNAFNNLFWSAGSIAVKEWTAAQNPHDDEAAERELCQFYWATPFVPPIFDLAPLDVVTLRQRTDQWGKGQVPPATEFLTVGVDIGKWVSWWVAIAWQAGGAGHVIDYGSLENPSGSMQPGPAILASLREFRDDVLATGWPIATTPDFRVPDMVFVDCRYLGDEAVKPFTLESGDRVMPSIGHGEAQQYANRYSTPKGKSKTIGWVGAECHVALDKATGAWAAHVNADYWKTWLHEGLGVAIDPAADGPTPGAITLYHSTDRNEHLSLSKHLTAEKRVEEFIPERGTVTKWVRLSRKNHWLDCAYNACAAAHLVGVNLTQPRPAAVQAAAPEITAEQTSEPYLLSARS